MIKKIDQKLILIKACCNLSVSSVYPSPSYVCSTSDKQLLDIQTSKSKTQNLRLGELVIGKRVIDHGFGSMNIAAMVRAW